MGVLFVDILAVIIWIQVLQRLDRFRKYRTGPKLYIQFYLAGVAVSLVTPFLYEILFFAFNIPYYAATLAGAFLMHVLIVGPVEEMVKFMAFALPVWRKDLLRDPVEGLLQAATVALGFASVENLSYGMAHGVGLTVWRSVFSIIGHMSYAGLWGFFYAALMYERKTGSSVNRPMLHLAAALFIGAFGHGMYNTFCEAGLMPLGLVWKGCMAAAVLLGLRHFTKMSPYAENPGEPPMEAMQRIHRGLLADPDSYTLHLRLAFQLITLQRYGEAAGYIMFCRRRRPGNAPLLFFSGFCEYAQGLTDTGATIIGEAVCRMNRRTYALVRKKLNSLGVPVETRTEIDELVREALRHSGKPRSSDRPAR